MVYFSGTTKSPPIRGMLETGPDMMTNIYDVDIIFPGLLGYDTVTNRIVDFQIPNAGIETVTKKKGGDSLDLPVTNASFDRKFSMTFRSDSMWYIYRRFCNWMSIVADPNAGTASPYANQLGQVRVYCPIGPYYGTRMFYNNEDQYIKELAEEMGVANRKYIEWRFFDVWVSKVTSPSFNTETSGAVTFSVDFQFGDCKYPAYGGIE